MDFWQSLSGTLTVELTSADVCGAMLALQKKGIDMQLVEKPDPMRLLFRIRRRDFPALEAFAEKRGEMLKIVRREGLYWQLFSLRKRPVLVAGLILLLLFTLWVPGRIFFVEVEGNTHIASRQIAQVAAQCGISFGASRREVRSEKMKNALLEAMPSLSWAGVNTNGCTAIITVREREAQHSEETKYPVSSIVASRDGIIREMTVLHGNAVCKIGQAVKAGQVLISGYTDCGISIRATRAKGEIYAATTRHLSAIMPGEYAFRGKKTAEQKKYSLIIGKKRINFANSSGISCGTCAKIYTEKYVTLPGGFVLPIGIAVETWVSYESVPAFQDAAYMNLQELAHSYLTEQMNAGSIELASEETWVVDGLWYLSGSYSCCEMIGINRAEENFSDYVQNN